ncbi:hypothetical protein [Streptomyces drozdowiczii]|nr:hypothetical protein [Streptomyces drozdowiczii]
MRTYRVVVASALGLVLTSGCALTANPPGQGDGPAAEGPLKGPP